MEASKKIIIIILIHAVKKDAEETYFRNLPIKCRCRRDYLPRQTIFSLHRLGATFEAIATIRRDYPPPSPPPLPPPPSSSATD